MFYGIPDTRRDKNKRHLRFWRGAAGVVILFVISAKILIDTLHSTLFDTIPMSGKYFLAKDGLSTDKN